MHKDIPSEVELKLIEKLVLNNICGESEIEKMHLKLKIKSLINYEGNFFSNKVNECFIRYFDESPLLVAVICEYEYNDVDYDINNLEEFLKRQLRSVDINCIDF